MTPARPHVTTLVGLILITALSIGAHPAGASASLPELGRVPQYQLTDEAGRPAAARDLAGRVWVAGFFFTSCAGTCPVVIHRMAELSRWATTQRYNTDTFALVSFSVDPERDTPERLRAYAAEHGIDLGQGRWHLLTGPLGAIERVVVQGFKLALEREAVTNGAKPQAQATPPPAEGRDGLTILHSSHLVLVDRQGVIRGYYESDDHGLAALEHDIASLLDAGSAPARAVTSRERLGDRLAALNAALNCTAALLLLLGWLAIRNGDALRHRRLMLSALGVSTLFLISYLTRVALTGTHRYPGDGVMRAIYLGLLGSHMLLAAATPPLVLAAIYYALKSRLATHRRIVRYAYPIWLYVSVTGVLVYLMLYTRL